MRVPSTLFSLPSRSIVRRTLDPSSPCTHHTRSALAIYNAAVMLLAPAQHARTCHTNMSHEHVTQHASAENSRHSGIPVCATTPSVASFLVKCPSTLRPFLPPPPQAPHPSRTPALQSLALPLSPSLPPHSRLPPPPFELLHLEQSGDSLEIQTGRCLQKHDMQHDTEHRRARHSKQAQ